MTLKELKDGSVYRLTRDVANPEPDRRMTRDWTRAPIWQAGILVCYSGRSYPQLRARGFYDDLTPTHDGFAAFVAALEPAPRNFDNVMFGLHRGSRTMTAYGALRELVRQGRVTLDEVETAFAADAAREDDGQ